MAGPFLTRHLYLQWGGSLPGNETWSCGVRMAPPGPTEAALPTRENASTLLEDGLVAVVQAFHTRANTGIHSAAKLQFVKANLIGVDGKYESLVTNERVLANLPGGAAGAIPPPNQCAMVVSLRADVSRGAASKGRFYLPLPVTSTLDATTGLLAADWVGAIEESSTTFVSQLNAALQVTVPGFFGWFVAIMSRKATGPATRRVENVLVGRVIDTQRRRRRSLPESYVD